MRKEDIAAAGKTAHAQHVGTYDARVHQATGMKAVIMADMTKAPIYAEAFILDTEKGKLSSVAFSMPITASVNESWRAMQTFVEAWHAAPDADWTAPAKDGAARRVQDVRPAPAAGIIRRLGLFGQDAIIGRESFMAFEEGLRQAHGDQADAILEKVDRERFIKVENARLRRGLAEFVGDIKIHREALTALQAVDDFGWRELEFYGLMNERGKFRRQAAATYPLLARFFANNSNFTRQIIEKQAPLNAAMAERFKIKEKALKPLQGKTWPTHGLRDADLLQAVSSIPPDWFPKTEEDWASFCILVKTIGREIGMMFEGLAENPLDILFKGAKGNWREFHERCATAFLDTRPPQGLDAGLSAGLMKKTDFKALAKAKAASDEELATKIKTETARFMIEADDVRTKALAWMKRCVSACADTQPPADLAPDIAQAAMEQLDFGALWKAKSGSSEDFEAKVAEDVERLKIKDEKLQAATRDWMKDRIEAIFGTAPPNELQRDVSSLLMTRLDFAGAVEAMEGPQAEFDAKLQTELSRFVLDDKDMRSQVEEWMVRRVTPDMSEENMKLAASSTREMLVFVRDHLVLPAAALAAQNLGNVEKFVIRSHQMQKCGEVATRLLFLPDSENLGAGKAAPNILETTRSFLNNMTQITGAIFNEDLNLDMVEVPEGHWPRLFNGQIESPAQGYYFEPLTNEEQLKEEGKALSHCVGGYGQTCRNGGHIVAFRKRVERFDALGKAHQQYQHVGTMEITKPKGRGYQFVARQFFGRGNGYFDEGTRRIGDWLLMQLTTGQIKVNWETIEAYQAGRQDAVPNEVHRICGYDWTKEVDVSSAMSAMKPLLHKAVNKEARNAGDLIGHDVMLPAIGAIDMIYGAQVKSRAPAI